MREISQKHRRQMSLRLIPSTKYDGSVDSKAFHCLIKTLEGVNTDGKIRMDWEKVDHI